MGDAGGFEDSGGFAVDRDAHRVANGFDDQRVPFAGFELIRQRIGDALALEQGGTFGLLGGVFHLVDVVAHRAFFFVDDGYAIEADLGAAEVAVVRAGVLAVVKLNVDHRSAFEADLDLDDAVLGGDVKPMHGGVRRDGGLAVFGRHGLFGRLGSPV